MSGYSYPIPLHLARQRTDIRKKNKNNKNNKKKKK